MVCHIGVYWSRTLQEILTFTKVNARESFGQIPISERSLRIVEAYQQVSAGHQQLSVYLLTMCIELADDIQDVP